LAAELVEHLVDGRREVRVRRGQIVVQRPFETRPRATDGRVADHVRGEVALRVAPEVEGSLVDVALHVRGEAPERGSRDDQPPVHRELGDTLDRVVLDRRAPELPTSASTSS
jgi:hypothetical protein